MSYQVTSHADGSTQNLELILNAIDRKAVNIVDIGCNQGVIALNLALHGFKGLMVFAEDVLVRVGIGCAVVAALSIIGSAVAICLKLFNYATPGWFSVALGILLLVFLQTGALTLMTLLLTGVVRGGLVANMAYLDFVDRFDMCKSIK